MARLIKDAFEFLSGEANSNNKSDEANKEQSDSILNSMDADEPNTLVSENESANNKSVSSEGYSSDDCSVLESENDGQDIPIGMIKNRVADHCVQLKKKPLVGSTNHHSNSDESTKKESDVSLNSENEDEPNAQASGYESGDDGSIISGWYSSNDSSVSESDDEDEHLPTETNRNQIAENYVKTCNWILSYYKGDLKSWSWQYPYKKAYISDIKGFSSAKIKYEYSEPLSPYQQLISVLPSVSKELIPLPLRHLMSETPDFDSPESIAQFKNKVEEEVSKSTDLTDEEIQRNTTDCLYVYESGKEVQKLSRNEIKQKVSEMEFLKTRNPDENPLRNLKKCYTLSKTNEKQPLVLRLKTLSEDERNIKDISHKLIGKELYCGSPYPFLSKCVGIADAATHLVLREENKKVKKEFKDEASSVERKYKLTDNIETGPIWGLLYVRPLAGKIYTVRKNLDVKVVSQWKEMVIPHTIENTLLKCDTKVQNEMNDFVNVNELYPIGSRVFIMKNELYGFPAVIKEHPQDKDKRFGIIRYDYRLLFDYKVDGALTNDKCASCSVNQHGEFVTEGHVYVKMHPMYFHKWTIHSGTALPDKSVIFKKNDRVVHIRENHKVPFCALGKIEVVPNICPNEEKSDILLEVKFDRVFDDQGTIRRLEPAVVAKVHAEAIVLKANLFWLTLPVVFSRVSGTDLIAAEAKYHKKYSDKFMATKPKCDVVHDVNKTIFAQFLEEVKSKLKKRRIYHISDFKEKLRKVFIDNELVWQRHRLLWLKRSLDRHFGIQLIKLVDPRKGTLTI
ncbi:hypothetical protein QYM36_012115 [Artemia franciscana]|uniref:Xrn1 helical domain-containing protein n=1 Tax=Artemia franciscana TaxID=6661 RepID=A0AA88L7E7_ARTSF|nr:hypothetical protein QYM36_012115 [Artemia franciscana]